jgi:WD40 repeat protein/serine/threonine protein kinase
MSVCHACHRELDEASRIAGKCSACGAVQRSIAHRTIAEVRSPKRTEDDELSDAGKTVEIAPGQLGGSIDIQINLGQTLPETPAIPVDGGGESTSSSKTVSEPPIIKIPLGPREGSGPKPATIAFNAGATIEFTGSESAIDESMLTSQWEGTIPQGGGAAGATIRQKETITGSYVSSSSLIVKSRHVTRTTGGTPAARPVSPADAPDYELLNVIGEGGMGVVYAARQSSIARTVALKMLKAADADLSQRDKFISEAVVTGELDHPNIVPIYDLGANDDGALFYSMKRVKGTPWHKVLKDRTLDENLNILLRVADAVAFAHVNGVIHRDLKPENVMLGDFGEVLVMDWGLARVTAEFPNAASITQSDAMGGTPAYMAPEMATGPLERITPASDVYLLGAILYEIITGKPPHTGKTVMACLFAAAKNQIAPSDKSGELVEIALKAMASKPEVRYQTVQEFQEAVREYQAHAESLRLLSIARKHIDEGARKQDYELYARAIYALEDSLNLWSGNHKAEALLGGTRIDYARLALAKGDFDLGASLLNPAVVEHQPVLADIDAGRRERESRKRWVKLLRTAVVGLGVAVVAIATIAYFAVSKQRDEAFRQRGLAVVAREDAEEQRDVAVTATAAAVAAREDAEKARTEEEKQRVAAEQNAEAARVAEIAATEARDEAVDARESEEYEAYIARIGLTKVKLDENSFEVAADLLEDCPADLRNWEWGRLRFLTQMAYQSWPAPAPIYAVAFAPDGAHFATGAGSGQAAIWNLTTGQPEHALPQTGEYVHAVAYDAAGERLAVGSSDGSVIVYRVADREPLARLVGHEGGVHSVRFSPDGARLLTCGVDETARLWDLATQRELQKLQGHTWWVWSAEFSPDAQRLVTAGQDGQVVVWHPDPKAPATADFVPYVEYRRFAEHVGPVYAARFAPNTGEIASAGNDGRVLIWKPEDLDTQPLQDRIDQLEFRDGTVIAPARQPLRFRSLTGHRGPIRTLAYSTDGQSLASGGEDNVIIVWNAQTGAPLRQLRGHASHVTSCAFSPSGEFLLSGGRDEQLKLWRPADGGETRALAAQEDDGQGVLSARFSADGGQVVSASRDFTASLWDVASLDRRQHFAEGHDFLATAAAFYADGTRVATAAMDGTVRIWNVATGAELNRLAGTGYAAIVAVSDDGRWVATASTGPDALVWDATTGELAATLKGGDATTMSALRFAPGSSELLATGNGDGEIHLWRRDLDSGVWHPTALPRVHSRGITALAFVAEGARLISASRDNTCTQWNVPAHREIPGAALRHPEAVADMAVTRNGQTAFTICDDGQLREWSLADARLVRVLGATGDAEAKFTSVDASADGSLVAAANATAGTIRIWNTTTGAELTAPNGANAAATTAWLDFGRDSNRIWGVRFVPDGQQLLAIGGNDAVLRDVQTAGVLRRFSPHSVVAAADISPDGTRVATGSWDRTVKIWDAATGRVIVKLPELHADAINSIVYSPTGDRLLTASKDGTARLWNATTGAPLEPVLRGHTGEIHQACFSPDGTHILTAGADSTARVWNALTGAEALPPLAGHKWGVLSAAYSANGERIITGSEDNSAIVWNAKTGELISTLAGHTAGVTATALSPDGTRALTGSQDNAAKLWDATTGKEILTLAAHASEVTSAAFSPDGRTALTSGRDSQILLWPTVDWTAPLAKQARVD